MSWNIRSLKPALILIQPILAVMPDGQAEIKHLSLKNQTLTFHHT